MSGFELLRSKNGRGEAPSSSDASTSRYYCSSDFDGGTRGGVAKGAPAMPRYRSVIRLGRSAWIDKSQPESSRRYLANFQTLSGKLPTLLGKTRIHNPRHTYSGLPLVHLTGPGLAGI